MSRLTKYKEGSFQELWVLTYPMMLTLISSTVMMLADRLFLAHYSVAAMNAAALAGMVVAIFQYGTASITSITEVFTGQFNGAQKYTRVGAPTWQMIWFSVSLLLLFGGLAIWGGPYLLPAYHLDDFALPYYQWLLYFSVATPMLGALSGFFIGIGNTRIVMVVTIGGNLINVCLDPVFIFTLNMGAKGAAIATGISMTLQTLVLFFVFLRRSNRQKYGTGCYKFEKPLFVRCMKVGVPNAIGHMIEWSAWALATRIMASLGESYLTVATVGQSMYGLIAFGVEGLQKAVITIGANCIGANKLHGIWRVWRKAIGLLLIFGIPFGILMLAFPDIIINQFLPPSSSVNVAEITPYLRMTAAGVFIYYLVDGVTWISAGILTASEDTWFIMRTNAITAWLCALMPIYIFLAYFHLSPGWFFIIMSFYGLCNAFLFFRRIQKQPWSTQNDALLLTEN